MNALAVLYLILPFPLAFLLHDAEELAVQHHWMLKHKETLIARFPKMRRVVEHLSRLNTKAFAIAATEEFVLLLVATAYVLIGGTYAMQIWAALFMAFSFHLLVHICQAIVVRGYVPGLISTILLLPYAFFGMQSIYNVMSGMEIFGWGIAGVIAMVLNLIFAHFLGSLVK